MFFPEEIVITKAGECYHVNECHHVRGRRTSKYASCRRPQANWAVSKVTRAQHFPFLPLCEVFAKHMNNR